MTLSRIKMPIGSNPNPDLQDPKEPITPANNDPAVITDPPANHDPTGPIIEPNKTIVIDPAADPNIPPASSTDLALNEGDQVDIDGIVFTVDKDGNALAADGTKKTKDELVTLSKASDEPASIDYVSEIQSATNLILTNKEGQPVVYENTVAGLAQYVADVHTQAKEIGAKELESTLFERYPIIKDVLTHLQLNNGKLDNFVNEPDFRSVAIADNDPEQWTNLYIQAQVKRGISEEEARLTAKYLKEDGKLKDFASSSLKFLNEDKSKRDANQASIIASRQAQEEAANTKYWNEVITSANNGKIKLSEQEEYNIPEAIRVKEGDKIIVKTKKDFIDYMTKPLAFNVDGQRIIMTKHDYDAEVEASTRTSQHDLFEAYKRFIKYDESQILKSKVNNQVAKQVLKLTSKANSNPGSGATSGGFKIILPVKS